MRDFPGLSGRLTERLPAGTGRFLVPIAVGWALLVGMRMSFPVVLPYVRAEYGLSLAAAGFLVTVVWLGSAVGQLPGGVLCDRYGERKVMTASMVLIGTAVVLVVTARTAAWVYLATGLVGLSMSLYPVARITILMDLFPDRLGSAIGVMMASGDIGQTVVPPVAGLLASLVAWQAGLGVTAPLFVVVGLVLWLVLPADTGGSRSNNLSTENLPYVVRNLRSYDVLAMSGILFLYMFIWQAFTAFYPTYLVDVKGVSPPLAGVLFALFFANGIVFKPLAGVLYDRVGMRRSLVFIFAGPIVGLALLPVIERFWQLAVITVLISMMLGAGATTHAFLADVLPEDMRGTGLGAVRTTTATLASGGPLLFGLGAEAGYFDESYVVLAVVTAGIVIAALSIPLSEPSPD